MSIPSDRRLVRLLEAPHLPRLVPTLPPETLHRIIDRCGLDACGGLVALATPAQLTSVLDLDLWRPVEPGGTERLDVGRFGEWLEVLADADTTLAAHTLAALDPALVVAGLSRFVRVFDPAAVDCFTTLDGAEVGRPAERDSLSCEVGGYRVRATHEASWDAVVALLIALEAGDPDRFHDVMRACRRLSDSTPEVDGLDDLLTAPEQLLLDVASARQARRSRQGYSSVADAHGFLRLARHRRQQPTDMSPPNAVVAAYFRSLDEASADAAPAVAPLPPADVDASPDASDVRATLDVITELLADDSTDSFRPMGLLGVARTHDDGLGHIRTLLTRLASSDAEACAERMRELAFLTNTLVAGCSFRARAFTPEEASRAAAATCNLGLELVADGLGSTGGLVSAFEAGWAALHDDVAMFTIARLGEVLTAIRSGDTATHSALLALRHELIRAHAAAEPWRVHDALDALAGLDAIAWTGLLGLTGECPTLPAAVDAAVSGHAGSVSATDFQFISTTHQIDRVHAFVAKLPQLLGA